jgi:glycosyltransferase involved in cell wall biosynthesis
MKTTDETIQKMLVIIPAYNEARKIDKIVRDIKILFPHVLVVDDGSRDDTAKKASAAGAKVIHHYMNRGYRAALRTGHEYFLSGAYEYVVQFDGDGQHKSEFISHLLDPVLEQQYDMSIGSRFLGLGSYRPTFMRSCGIFYLRWLLRFLSGCLFTDPTSGFRCMNRKACQFLTQLDLPKHGPSVDVLLILILAGMKVREVPVIMNYNHEKSIYDNPYKNVLYMCRATVFLLKKRLSKRRLLQNLCQKTSF